MKTLKQWHLYWCKTFQRLGWQKLAGWQFSKAAEIHLKISDKNKAQ